MPLADTAVKRRLDFALGTPLLFALKPVSWAAGKLLGRDHADRPRGRITVLKLLGGGSLVIAFPSLLGLRRAHPDLPLHLVTTRSVEPFAQLLGLFDRIHVIEDRSLFAFLRSSFLAWARNFRADTVVDLEVYSRLSTLFSLITCARNRMGFYLNDLFWRKSFNTHLVYFNRFGPVERFYEKTVRWLGAVPVPVEEARRLLTERLPVSPAWMEGSMRVCIGHGCSGLGFERKLSPTQWARALPARLPADRPVEVRFLGARGDRAEADAVAAACAPLLPKAVFKNLCGELPLEASVACLAGSELFLGIDSALLHFARLLGVACVSFFGPTSPRSLLPFIPGLKEDVRYAAIPCSPCIHVAETPPCGGRNLCMDALFDPEAFNRADPRFITWAPDGR